MMKKILILSITLFLANMVLATNCIDSDDGINYATKGRVIHNGLNFSDECKDFQGTPLIKEWYCEYDYARYTEKQCYGTCSDGACSSVEKPTGVCEDSDGGHNIYKHGRTTGALSDDVYRKIGNFTDSCPSNKILAEAYCKDGLVYWDYVTCENGCVGDRYSGYCYKSPEDEKCVDSDGGINYATKGIVTWYGEFRDECTTFQFYSMIKEWYCEDGSPKYIEKRCYGTCYDGACLPPEKPIGICEDSDGGINTTVKGTTKNNYYEVTDTCFQYSYSREEVDVYECKHCLVREYYCDSENNILSKSIDCSSGACKDGRCLEPFCEPECVAGFYCKQYPSGTQCEPLSNNTCSETDAGDDIYKNGITTGAGVGDAHRTIRNYSDYCMTTQILYEFHCEDGLVKTHDLTCEYGCIGNGNSGYCKEPTFIQKVVRWFKKLFR